MADFNLRISLDFLAQLAVNNNRDWFQSHKDWYTEAYSQFLAFSQEYVARLAEVDDNLLGLQAKDCIWRIYRDVRFSADKRPYKEWFGVFPAAKGGKKSLHGGYYVHIQPGHCMFAAGIWSPTPELLKTLRKEIWANYDEIEEIMAQPDFQRYFTDFDTDDMLKKVPQGFDPRFCACRLAQTQVVHFQHTAYRYPSLRTPILWITSSVSPRQQNRSTTSLTTLLSSTVSSPHAVADNRNTTV